MQVCSGARLRNGCGAPRHRGCRLLASGAQTIACGAVGDCARRLPRATQVFRVSSALLVLVALASVGPAAAQNVLGIDFGSEWIKLAVVQRSAGVQIVLNEVTPAHARLPEHTARSAARALCVHSCAKMLLSPAQSGPSATRAVPLNSGAPSSSSRMCCCPRILAPVMTPAPF